MNGSRNRDEFIVYCHEIIPGSDVGLHFAATLEAAQSGARTYRDAFRAIDPTGDPLGILAVCEMILRMPDIATMIDLLNSPESLLRMCLKSRKRVAVTVD